MKKIIIKKWSDFSLFYNQLDRSKKNIVLMLIFFILTLFAMQYLMLNSVDDYHKSLKKEQDILQTNQSLLIEQKQLSDENIAKSEISLVKQKKELKESIEKLIEKNQLFDTKDSDVPVLLQNILQNVGQLTLLNLSNEQNMKSSIQGTLLNKHFFNLKIQGSYQNIYDFITKISQQKNIHLESIIIQRNNKLTCEIIFYIINQNQSLLNLGNNHA